MGPMSNYSSFQCPRTTGPREVREVRPDPSLQLAPFIHPDTPDFMPHSLVYPERTDDGSPAKTLVSLEERAQEKLGITKLKIFQPKTKNIEIKLISDKKLQRRYNTTIQITTKTKEQLTRIFQAISDTLMCKYENKNQQIITKKISIIEKTLIKNRTNKPILEFVFPDLGIKIPEISPTNLHLTLLLGGHVLLDGITLFGKPQKQISKKT